MQQTKGGATICRDAWRDAGSVQMVSRSRARKLWADVHAAGGICSGIRLRCCTDGLTRK